MTEKHHTGLTQRFFFFFFLKEMGKGGRGREKEREREVGREKVDKAPLNKRDLGNLYRSS